jgi:hypothetical protein
MNDATSRENDPLSTGPTNEIKDKIDGEDLNSEEAEDAIQKEQYGSVLDYLEAKYVRGVNIASYNSQGERIKRKKTDNVSTDEDENYDSDQDNNRSVYGDDGFIDDTLLEEEVVDQVFASDSYGKTKIEMEARRLRKEKSEKEEEDLSAESDLDDGFFVNIGDLEMEEGWRGDNNEILISPKRKPGRPKKSESEGEVKPKKRKVDKEDEVPKKKKKKVDGAVDKTKDKAKITKKKDGESKTKVVKQKNSTSSSDTKKKLIKQSPAKSSPKKSPAPKPKEPKEDLQTPKGIMEDLAKQTKRKFSFCVKLIGELTPRHLPRKPKQKLTAKVTVAIPADKNIGDTIMFE